MNRLDELQYNGSGIENIAVVAAAIDLKILDILFPDRVKHKTSCYYDQNMNGYLAVYCEDGIHLINKLYW